MRWRLTFELQSTKLLADVAGEAALAAAGAAMAERMGTAGATEGEEVTAAAGSSTAGIGRERSGEGIGEVEGEPSTPFCFFF